MRNCTICHNDEFRYVRLVDHTKIAICQQCGNDFYDDSEEDEDMVV